MIRELAAILAALALAGCVSVAAPDVGNPISPSAPSGSPPVPVQPAPPPDVPPDPTPAPTPVPDPPPLPRAVNVPVPVTGAYLGVRLDSTAFPSSSLPGAAQTAGQAAFEASIGRPRGMAFQPIFVAFLTPLPLASLTATGSRIPLVELACARPDDIAAGMLDASIASKAATMAAYGKPIMLRWCWEMDKADPARAPYAITPANFQAAWRRLRARLPANVSMIWCPSAADNASADYYPGDDVVDWIGGDGFLRPGKTRVPDLATVFGPWYATYAPRGKPMMIGATGVSQPGQAAALLAFAQWLQAHPAIKAVNYFNALGDNGDYTLTGDGLSTFAVLAATPYLSGQ